MNELYQAPLWHPAKEEPDASLDAWIVIQTGDDEYEVVKYGGYNKDGGLTWESNSRNRGLLRWMYLPIDAPGYKEKQEPKQLSLFD